LLVFSVVSFLEAILNYSAGIFIRAVVMLSRIDK
jgi:hypothetical protein